MSIELIWEDDEKTILRFNFMGTWTWDDYYPIHERAEILTRTMQHTVYRIVDLSQNRSVPASAITHLKNILDKQPDNAGRTVFITSNRFLLALYKTGVKINGKFAEFFYLAENLDEAYNIIADAKIHEASLDKGSHL